MPADLNTLDPAFKAAFEKLLADCARAGIEMRPYFAIRTPEEQARLWRQSRTTEEIRAKIKWLEDNGAPYLAKVLRDVGPQSGRHVTNALPGFSWHQWGEAVDSFWVVDGAAEWSPTRKVNGQNGYRVYAAKAAAHGLDAGGLWKRLKDWPHIQKRSAASPLSAGFTPAEIDREMKRRFG